MIVINIPRLVLYWLLIGLAIGGIAPWWIAATVILYDMTVVTAVPLPKWIAKWLEARAKAKWEKQKLERLDALVRRLDVPIGKAN